MTKPWISYRLRMVGLIYGTGAAATELFLLWDGIQNGALDRYRPDLLQHWLLPSLGHLVVSALWPLFWGGHALHQLGILR